MGEVMATAGALLSTVMVALGPAALEALPWASVAVPPSNEKLSVPLPEQLVRVSVRALRVAPDTANVQLGLPESTFGMSFAKYGVELRMLAAPPV